MKIFRYDDGALANTALFIYLLVGSLVAALILCLPTTSLLIISLKIVTIVFLSHLLVLMAYLAHEAMHNTVFRKTQHNDYLGKSLSWLLGASYLPYKDLKAKHMRHHTERQDVLTVDYRQWLEQYPTLFTLVKKLQRWHFPAAELVTHFLAMAAPFLFVRKSNLRIRVVAIALSRMSFFAVLLLLSPWLLVGFLLAQLGSMVVLGFMDAYQHTYEIAFTLDDARKPPTRSREYEEQHTYTNLLSAKFPVINLLVLNFCYHNVHHWKSGEPWHRLPGLHQQRYSGSCEQYVSFREQVKNFHTYRVTRIESDPQVRKTTNDETEKIALNKRIGAAGVSFLVGV